MSDRSDILYGFGNEPKKKTVKKVRKTKVTKPGSGDFAIVALVTALVVFGIIMVFSSGYYSSITTSGASPYAYLIRQVVYAAAGSAGMIFLMMFDYHRLGKLAVPLLILAYILVALTYSPLGQSYNNASRWLPLPGGFSFIPAEAAKLSVIVFVAAFLAAKPDRIDRPVSGLGPVLAAVLGLVLAVYLQPATSTAMTIMLIAVGIIFIGGVKFRYLIILGVTGITALAARLVMESNDASSGGAYKMQRLVSFLDPFADASGSGYQVVHGIYALSSGGFFGSGIGKGVEKALYLPDPMNDFILATIGEELGMIGIVVLIIVYIILIWRCLTTAMKAADILGALMASGITIMLALQVVLNIMIVLSLFPPTGIALPFVSYGGTSLIIFMMSMGIIVNISRYPKGAEE